MHLICPKCATSYQLDAAAIGASGRSVRCTRCKNVWFAAAPELRLVPAVDARDEAAFREELGSAAPAATAPIEGPTQEASPATASAQATKTAPAEAAATTAEETSPDAAGGITPGGADAEPMTDATAPPPEAAAVPALSDIKIPSVAAPPLAPGTADAAGQIVPLIPSEPEDIESVAARRMPASPAAPRRRRPPKSKLPIVILVLVAACAAILGWRKDIVRHAPQMASLYSLIGMPVNVRGLVFADVRIANDTHDGVPVLAVEGTIVSVVSAAVEVPRLRFAFRNAAGQEVYSWTALPTQTVLAPGETLAFRSRVASPPGDVHDVQVRFFNRRDTAAGGR